MSRSEQQLRNQPMSRRVFSLPQPADGMIGRSGRCQRRNRTMIWRRTKIAGSRAQSWSKGKGKTHCRLPVPPRHCWNYVLRSRTHQRLLSLCEADPNGSSARLAGIKADECSCTPAGFVTRGCRMR